MYDVLISSLYEYTITHKLPITHEFWDPKETSCFDTPQNWDILPNISIAIAHNASAYFILDLPGSVRTRNKKPVPKYLTFSVFFFSVIR